ncbi:MAG TPA: phenylalanine--tRNA ligase beta subunit-related protein, partial [Thermoanaerobaculia bacterium]|nr:phenylalanine--tRNA ligase beta subunit-related protein [Thermoanaerobaculia bacterium]
MKFSLDWLGDFVDTAAAGGPEGVRRLLEQAGIPLETMERAGSDVIFDFEITPNRPDAMSHRGLAREIAAMAGLSIKAPSAAEPAASGAKVDELASVTIEVPRLCRRFGARVVRGIGTGPASERVRARLSAIGAKSISAAVDATNYVLWEIGQPLHAFDLDKLAGGRVIVRRARKGEKLVLLDGVEYTLSSSDVVVADAERAVSLAGIMGGLETAVGPETKNVLLEAAWWDPASIRRTSRRLGLHTDASHRFERGADFESTVLSCDLVAQMILQSGGGELIGDVVDVVSKRMEQAPVVLRVAEVRRILGGNLDAGQIFRLLKRLGFTLIPEGQDDEQFSVQI